MKRQYRLAAACALLPALVASGGCVAIGPKTVPRDRFDYSYSITESWKRQTLLNIVKLRYLDPPVFVDVGQIVAGYSLETTLSAGGTLSSGAVGDSVSLGGSGKFTDRPTITYTPLTGSAFIRGLLTPLPPATVFFTVQSGWPADGVLFLSLASINGIKNQETTPDGVIPADPRFMQVLALLRKIQLSGAVGMRVIQGANEQEASILTFRSADVSPETIADITALRSLLRIDQDATELELVFSSTQSDGRKLAVLTRSIFHVMMNLAAQVDVPPEHVAEGRTAPGWALETTAQADTRLIRISSSTEEPEDAFVTVRYRDHWFWIDDRDLKSKRVFALMMLMFTLADTGERQELPLITIPAQ